MDWKNQLTKTPYLVLLVILFAGTLDDAFAETFLSVNSGFYDLKETWEDTALDPAVVAPAPHDDKVIRGEHTVTIRNPDSNSGKIQNFGNLIIDTTFNNTGFLNGGVDGL